MDCGAQMEKLSFLCSCCDEKEEEATVEVPMYDYYNQAEILDSGLNEEEEEEEGSQQPELGARVQVQLRVQGGSFSPTASKAAFSCRPIVSHATLLLLSIPSSFCHFLL